MAGRHDIHVDQGSHLRLVIRWGVKDDDELTEHDLDGAAAQLEYGSPWPAAKRDLSIEDNAIILDISGDETAWLVLPLDYVIVVTLASGERRHVLEGRLIGKHRNARGRYA